MKYNEISKKPTKLAEADDPENAAFYAPEEDAQNRQELGNTRKPTLTLRMVNRLKKMRATKAVEMSKKDDLLGVMYGIKPEADDI